MSPTSPQVLGSSFRRLHPVVIVGASRHLCPSSRRCCSSSKHFLLLRLPRSSFSAVVATHCTIVLVQEHLRVLLSHPEAVDASSSLPCLPESTAVAPSPSLSSWYKGASTPPTLCRSRGASIFSSRLQTKAANQGAEPSSSHRRCRAVLPSPSQERTLSSSPLSRPSDRITCPPTSSPRACGDSQDPSRFLKSSPRPASFVVFAPQPQGIKHRHIVVVC